MSEVTTPKAKVRRVVEEEEASSEEGEGENQNGSKKLLIPPKKSCHKQHQDNKKKQPIEAMNDDADVSKISRASTALTKENVCSTTRKKRRIDDLNKSSRSSDNSMTTITEDVDARCPKLLELFLNLRPTECVVPIEAWDYLTFRDLMQLQLLSKTLHDQLQYVSYPKCCNSDNDDYLVPFPGFPGLNLKSILKRNESDEFTGGLFSHQLASLRAMHEMENPNRTCDNPSTQQQEPMDQHYDENHEQRQDLTSNVKRKRGIQFGTLRGGVLGDAPGLGKTITMLALICSSAGTRPVTPPTFWDEKLIQDMWELIRLNSVFREDLAVSLSSVFVECRQRYQLSKDQKFWSECNRIRKLLSPPYKDGLFPTFDSFKREVKREYRSIGISRTSLASFEFEIKKFVSSLDKKRRRFNLTPEGRRIAHERSLIPSSGTLIVVPNALMEHWYQQIHQNLKLETFSDGEDDGFDIHNDIPRETVREGVVYVMGLGDLADIGKWSTLRTQGLVPSPPALTLSRYTIVLLSFEWCRKEFEEEHRSGRMVSKTRRSVEHTSNQSFFSTIRSSLLEVRWLRLVVDEGHELGTHETASDLTTFIHHIAAERRWVLSGTPTTGDEDDEDHTSRSLDQIQRLLVFLRHPDYGTSKSSSCLSPTSPSSPSISSSTASVSPNKKSKRRRSNMSTEERDIFEARAAWERDIKIPFLQKQSVGKERLLTLLKSVMVMHRKEDIDLPKPFFLQAEVDIPFPQHVEDQMRQDNPTLDGTTLAFQINRYTHTDDFQSLVDFGQANYIIQTLREARKERDSSSQGRLVNGKVDSRPIKAVVYSSNVLNLRSVTDQVISLVSAENVAELYHDATVGDLSSEMSRFRNGVREHKVCPICQRRGDVTEIRCRHPLMEVVSMRSLINNRAASSTNNINDNGEGQRDDDEEERFLIEPERIRSTINVPLERMEGVSLSNYWKNTRFWRPNDILQVDVRNSHPLLARREPEGVWREEYGANKCRTIAKRMLYQGPDWYFGPLPYAGTDEQQEEADGSAAQNGIDSVVDDHDGGAHNNRNRARPPYALDVSLVKFQPCGSFHSRGRWYKGPRYTDAAIERTKEDVYILSLDGGLSHGLDLSFVTHMFLLEPIEDAALLEQVTSRAHRLGATGSVMIETVNTFYKVVSKDLEEALTTFQKNKKSLAHDDNNIDEDDDNDLFTLQQQQEYRDKIVSQGVCDFCYRTFPTKKDAEKHELKCRNNPFIARGGDEDEFDLFTVYRDIRPPSAMVASDSIPS